MMNGSGIYAIPAVLIFAAFVPAQNIVINSLNPFQNQNYVDRDADIVMVFDQTISTASLNDSIIVIHGSQNGRYSGVYSGGGTETITFNPDIGFRAGEIISVTITTDLQGDSGQNPARGYTYSFGIKSDPPPSPPAGFAQRDISGASTQGRDVRVFDYDHDGDLDILAGTEGVPEQNYLYVNDGQLSFCIFNTGGNFRNVEVYDIDGDGDYDNFGATGAFDTELDWFQNDGSFPFTKHTISGEDPWTLAGGDLDSDGDIDVVAAVLIPNRVLWFANDGHGNFSPAKNIPTSFTGGSDSYFYIRELNSDGAMDILAFHRDAYDLVWYENDGAEVFSEHLIMHTTDPKRLACGDLDGDGDIDIVAVSTTNASISWFENDGGENFSEHPVTTTTSGRLYTVRITDPDGDQDMDILSGGYVFGNDGSENFTQELISAGLSAGSSYLANGIDAADMDADGDLDIVTLGFYALSWMENGHFMHLTGTEPVNTASRVPAEANIFLTFDQLVAGAVLNSETISVYSRIRGQAAGTFSGAGTNLIVFDPDENFMPGDNIEVSVNEQLSGTSGERLTASTGFSFRVRPLPAPEPAFTGHSVKVHANNATGLDVADMDGDGDPDLVSCSWSELYWHENDGKGNFATIPVTTTGTPVGVTAFDQNGDGFTDIWVDNDGSAASMLYTNDGSQNFTEGPGSGSLRLRQVADLNHDGGRDLIFTTTVDKWVRWLENFDCGGYTALGYLPNINSNDVAAGDMDNDGDTDFIAATASGPVFFENNGNFVFTTLSLDDNNVNSVCLLDLDGDGDPDPVFTESFSAVIWYENRLTEDSLDFGERQEIAPLNQDPRDVIAADIDGDGDADIASVSRNDDKVVWYENNLEGSTPGIGPERPVGATADGPVLIKAADLDGDGDMDLVTLSEGDDELIWFENTGGTSGIADHEEAVPLVYSLEQNYPNPFNPSTRIEFTLAKPGHVRLEIYNINGQKEKILINEHMYSGKHRFDFDGHDLPSGIYFYRILTEEFRSVKKMIMVR